MSQKGEEGRERNHNYSSRENGCKSETYSAEKRNNKLEDKAEINDSERMVVWAETS